MSPFSYFMSEAWRGLRQQRAVAINTLLALVGALLGWRRAAAELWLVALLLLSIWRAQGA